MWWQVFTSIIHIHFYSHAERWKDWDSDRFAQLPKPIHLEGEPPVDPSFTRYLNLCAGFKSPLFSAVIPTFTMKDPVWPDDVYLSLRCGALIPKVHWSRTLCKHSQGRGSHMWWRTWILDLISSLPKVNFSFGVSAWPGSVIITHRGNSRESKWGSMEWRDLEERVSLPPWRTKSPSYLSLGDKPAPNLMV